jgi:hypothetical protein
MQRLPEGMHTLSLTSRIKVLAAECGFPASSAALAWSHSTPHAALRCLPEGTHALQVLDVSGCTALAIPGCLAVPHVRSLTAYANTLTRPPQGLHAPTLHAEAAGVSGRV